jgi:hypothetical protein
MSGVVAGSVAFVQTTRYDTIRHVTSHHITVQVCNFLLLHIKSRFPKESRISSTVDCDNLTLNYISKGTADANLYWAVQLFISHSQVFCFYTVTHFHRRQKDSRLLLTSFIPRMSCIFTSTVPSR